MKFDYTKKKHGDNKFKIKILRTYIVSTLGIKLYILINETLMILFLKIIIQLLNIRYKVLYQKNDLNVDSSLLLFE